MKKRYTFICHNSQHIAKSDYYKDKIINAEEGSEFVFIWNAWEPLNRALVTSFDNIIELPPHDSMNRWVYAYKYEGRGFRLKGEYDKYNDLDTEEYIYIFSDEVLNTIKFLSLLKKCENKKYHIILLDEGLALYIDYSTDTKKYKAIIKNVLLGTNVQPSTFIGWHPDIESIIAQTPEDIVEKVRSNHVINKESMIWADNDYWEQWLNKVSPDFKKIPQNSIMYLGTADRYNVNAIEYEIFKRISLRYNSVIVVKPHPRASTSYKLFDNVIVLNDLKIKTIPAEIIYSALHPVAVYAIESSTVKNIVEQDKAIPVIMLYRLFGINTVDEFFISLKNKNDNIDIVNDINEL